MGVAGIYIVTRPRSTSDLGARVGERGAAPQADRAKRGGELSLPADRASTCWLASCGVCVGSQLAGEQAGRGNYI